MKDGSLTVAYTRCGSPLAKVCIAQTPLDYANMTLQFSLSRMFQLVVVVAILCSLFASLKWPVALLVLSGMNAVACLGFGITRRPIVAGFAGATTILILATLFYTNWGLSSLHPGVRVAWPFLIAACFSELATLVCWLLSENQRLTTEN